MAALVTNLTQVLALDANSMTSAAVGGATAAMPVVANSFQKGIDGSVNAQMLENEATALTAGVHYSAWQSFGGSTYDISGVDQAIVVHFKNNSPSYTTIETNSDSIYLIAFSGGGTTNYGRWLIDPTNIIDGTFYPLIMTGTPDATGGTFDDTAVTAYGFASESSETGGAFGFQITIDQLVYINGPAVFEDTGAAATVTLLDYYNLLKRDSGTTYHSLLVKSAGPTVEFGLPVDFHCDDYDDANVAAGIAFKPSDDKQWPVMASGYYQARWTPPASSTQLFQNFTAATTSTDFNATIDASAASCDLTFEASLFAGINDVIIFGAGLTMTATLASPATCDIADGNLSLVIDSPDTAVDWTADLVSGSNFTINTPVGDALTISFAETDLSDIAIIIPGSAEVNLTPTTGAGTYVLTGMTSAGTITFDNDTANNTTASVATALTAVQKGTTTGGGTVTIAAPAVTVDFAAPNLIDDTRVRLYNVTQAVEIENEVVSGGAGYTITLTRGVDYDNGDVVTLLATYQELGVAKRVFRASATLTTGDFTTSDSQVDWVSPGPNTLAVDGSTVIECTTDYIGVEVDIDDLDDTTQKSRIAAFIVDAITTADGIRNWVDLSGNPVITYSTDTAAQINASVATLTVNNNKEASTLSAQDSFEFDWSDGIDRVTALLGSGVLWLTPARVLLQATGSGVTAQDKIDIASEVMSFVTENGEQFLEAIRLIRASALGKSDVSGSTVNFRDAADSKNRITAITDTAGQRTAVTTDAT